MTTNLMIALPPELEGRLKNMDRWKGISPKVLVLGAIRDRLAGSIEPPHGGVEYIAAVLGIDSKTIRRGQRDLADLPEQVQWGPEAEDR